MACSRCDGRGLIVEAGVSRWCGCSAGRARKNAHDESDKQAVGKKLLEELTHYFDLDDDTLSPTRRRLRIEREVALLDKRLTEAERKLQNRNTKSKWPSSTARAIARKVTAIFGGPSE